MTNSTLRSNGLDRSLYTLKPVPPLLPFISDAHLLLLLPIVAYWAYGLLFYWIDQHDYLPQYRLHTPAEFLKRNRVPVSEVVTYVLKYQLLTTVIGVLLSGDADTYGMEEHHVAIWASRVNALGSLVPTAIFAYLGDGAKPFFQPRTLKAELYPGEAITSWQLSFGSYIYYYLVPTLQFATAIFFADTWQYFYHRLVHISPWLYTNFHSVHHKNFVPYAFGAFYSNMLEAFLVDVISTFFALSIAGLTTRQAMWFVTLSVLKAVDDHCGYAIPWDPFQWLTPQNALYHDIHHQAWGIKTNFAQTYTTFWDHALGTVWKGSGADLQARYERGEDVARQWAQGSGCRAAGGVSKEKGL